MSTNPSPPPRLAVVGGGISGLAAAHRLHRLLPQSELRLFEASGRLGGPLHTLYEDDAILEQGADSFLTKTPWALELCRELGIADELVPTNERHRRALVVRGGEVLPVPDGFVLMRAHRLGPVMRSPILSLRGKLRLLAEPLARAPAEINQRGYDESVASFAARRLGREAFQRLVQPLAAGIYVADAAKLSMAATMPDFLEAERRDGSLRRSLKSGAAGNDPLPLKGGTSNVDYEQVINASSSSDRRNPSPGPSLQGRGETAAARYGAFQTLRGGMRRLVDALSASLPQNSIQLNAPVRALARSDDGRWQATIGEDPAPEEFDGVIVAARAPAAADLLQKIDPQLSRLLARISYASSAVVTLLYGGDDMARPLDGFGIVVPSIENRPIIAASFPGVKFPHCIPAGQAAVRVFLGGVFRPELVDRDDDELVALAHHEMCELIGVRRQPLRSLAARWHGAMPQYHVGHVTLVDDIEDRTAAHRGLALAGNAYRGVGIPQCIQSGQAAAERIASDVAARPA